MNLKTFNESFNKYYTEDFDNEPVVETVSQELRSALESTVNYLVQVGQTNPTLQAMSLTRTIENIIPDKYWWEVTKCNIEGELGNGVPLDRITDCIIDNLQPEYSDITESVDDNDEYYVGDEETGRIYYGKSSALKAFNQLRADGIDAIMNKVEDDAINESAEDTEFPLAFIPVNDIAGKDFTHTLIGIVRRAGVKYHSAKKYAGNYYITIICKPEDLPKAKLAIENSGFFKSWLDKNESFNESSNRESIYDEPELLGKGYAAPTSRDFVKEVRVKLKYKAFEDLKDLQKYMDNTISDVEEFDAYWKAHKKAIMENIKEAQDSIPTEYRI